MGEFLGADPDSLDSLARSCNDWSRTLDTSRRVLNSRVHTAPWHGAHAEAFRAAWDSQYSPALVKVSAVLTWAGTVLADNAAQQRWASTAVPGSAAMPGVHGGPPPTIGTVDRGHPSLFAIGVNLFKADLHRAESDLVAGVQYANHLQHEVVSSRLFQDAVADSKMASSVLAMAAPFLALIPVVGPGVAVAVGVAAVATSAFALAGETAEMANGVRPWNVAELGMDTANVAFSAIGLGGLDAGGLEGAKALSSAFPNLSETSVTHVAVALNLASDGYKSVTTAIDVQNTSQQLVVDVKDHNYVGAVTDVATGAAEIAGASTHGAVSDQLGALQTEGTVLRAAETGGAQGVVDQLQE